MKIKLIVGLANPGREYSKTRHNAGAWYVERLSDRYNQSLKIENKFYGRTALLNVADSVIRLLIPNTFMNLSGKAVVAIANFYHILPEEILIAHDELDFLPGIVKLKVGGGNNGHNGLKDIQNKLANNANFNRLRIGIGHPGAKEKVNGYVLGLPSLNEKICIDNAIDAAISCTEVLLTEGTLKAMSRLHSLKENIN